MFTSARYTDIAVTKPVGSWLAKVVGENADCKKAVLQGLECLLAGVNPGNGIRQVGSNVR